MSDRLRNRRKSYDKLDGAIVPVIAFAGGILAKVATEQAGIFQKITLVLLIIAILAHYLSIETEAQVIGNNGVNTRSNKLTVILNSVRTITLTLGFLALIIGIIVGV